MQVFIKATLEPNSFVSVKSIQGEVQSCSSLKAKLLPRFNFAFENYNLSVFFLFFWAILILFLIQIFFLRNEFTKEIILRIKYRICGRFCFGGFMRLTQSILGSDHCLPKNGLNKIYA